MDNYALKITMLNAKRKKFNLKNINMMLEPGFIYAIAGENGAGKTTLFKYILSEGIKYSGDIVVFGENIRKNHKNAMNIIGFVSEDNIFFEKRTCKQNAMILGILYDKFDMELFNQIMDNMSLSPNRTYDKMSRGEKIKFQLAFAIAHQSRLLLLDEATTGMDPVFRIEFFDMLRRFLVDEKCCVLMTSHNMTEIMKQTDYVAIMNHGELSEFKESMEVCANV